MYHSSDFFYPCDYKYKGVIFRWSKYKLYIVIALCTLSDSLFFCVDLWALYTLLLWLVYRSSKVVDIIFMKPPVSGHPKPPCKFCVMSSEPVV